MLEKNDFFFHFDCLLPVWRLFLIPWINFFYSHLLCFMLKMEK